MGGVLLVKPKLLVEIEHNYVLHEGCDEVASAVFNPSDPLITHKQKKHKLEKPSATNWLV